MNTSAKSEHQFTEVDADLRRIGEIEAQKKLCPFGAKCYRKNPNHLKEFRHSSHSSPVMTPKDKPQKRPLDVRTGKITDFFAQKLTDIKTPTVKPSTEEDNYEIEDDSEDEMMRPSNSSAKDRPNTSFLTPKTKKLRNSSPFRSLSKTSSVHKKNGNKNRDNDCDKDCDKDLSNDLNAMLKEDNELIETKPKRNSFKPIEKGFSPRVSTLKPIEGLIEISSEKMNDSFGGKDSKQTDETIVENTLNLSESKPKLSPKELNELFKEIFLFEMPKDFFHFWQFCKTIKREKPEEALVKTLDLRLVGPYDILTGKVKKYLIKDKDQILCHWRYYYDLPEMQTIMASIKSGYHLAYFRDTPDEEFPVVVSNSGDNSCHIEGMSDNIFGAIHSIIQNRRSKDSSNKDLQELETKLKDYCNERKVSFTSKTKLMSRKAKINSKTFNGFGLVVPFDKKTEVGYRPLNETDTNLKKLLTTISKVEIEVRNECKSLSELKQMIQYVSYANDECDFGMGLELGIDLFCFGDPFFHKSVTHLLSMAYNLLNRDVFSRIIEAHISNRRKGFRLDCI